MDVRHDYWEVNGPTNLVASYVTHHFGDALWKEAADVSVASYDILFC